MTLEDFKEEAVTLSDAERLCKLYGWKHIWDDFTNLLKHTMPVTEEFCLIVLCEMLIKSGVFETQFDKESKTKIETEKEILSDFFKFLEE